jgi:uncharacterized protein (TIGR03084 family)
MSLAELIDALRFEYRQVDSCLDDIGEEGWFTTTPAPGWDVRDSVFHLAYFDEVALGVLHDPDTFRAHLPAITAHPDAYLQVPIDEGRRWDPVTVRRRWATAREQLCRGFADVDPSARLPWFGPDMSARSSMTARLMETFAHGHDIADALGRRLEFGSEIRSVAHLGFITRRYSYVVNGREVPTAPVRVELTGPGGEQWEWGDDDAVDTVHGPALDFCLVVTRRRHLDDTSLEISGALAEEWMSIAQAFAGAPGLGRQPLGARS